MSAAPPGVVVLGGGSAGWITAALLAKRWGGAAITVIESAEIGIIGVGEGSTPQMQFLFDHLGIDEAEGMAAADATCKLGIRFTGWSTRPGFGSYSIPFPARSICIPSPASRIMSCSRGAGLRCRRIPTADSLQPCWPSREGSAPGGEFSLPAELRLSLRRIQAGCLPARPVRGARRHPQLRAAGVLRAQLCHLAPLPKPALRCKDCESKPLHKGALEERHHGDARRTPRRQR